MEVTAEQLQRVNEQLRGLPGNKVYAALSNAANRAMMSARGVAWKSVHSMYTVNRTAFYQDTRIHTFRANSQSLSAAVTFGGYLIPLISFNVKGYRAHEKGRVRRLKAEVLTGIPKDLRHAYITDLGKYGVNVFERYSTERNSSQTLYGPSAAHMVENGEVIKNMDAAAKATFDQRLDHEIDRILRGYGGR
jgi:hypothetical protein